MLVFQKNKNEDQYRYTHVHVIVPAAAVIYHGTKLFFSLLSRALFLIVTNACISVGLPLWLQKSVPQKKQITKWTDLPQTFEQAPKDWFSGNSTDT